MRHPFTQLQGQPLRFLTTIRFLIPHVRFGSSLPVVAQVEDSSGNPIDGITVNFDITSGPNAGLTDSATSGPSSGPGYLCGTIGRLQGVAEFFYPSTQTGTDVIQASAIVNGTTLTTSTSFDWFNPASTVCSPGRVDLCFLRRSRIHLPVLTLYLTVSLERRRAEVVQPNATMQTAWLPSRQAGEGDPDGAGTSRTCGKGLDRELKELKFVQSNSSK